MNPDDPPAPAAAFEESAEELYEHAPCGYVTTRPDGTLARVNRTFLAWMGHAREDLVGRRRLQELLTIGGRIFWETHLGPLLRMQGTLNEIQVDLQRADGSALPVLLNATERRDAQGAPLAIRITVLNIEDRKRYERELLAARKRAEAATEAKAAFLSFMSHEIRTPLSAITATVGLLKRTPLSAPQQRYVRILSSSSDNLVALLNDLLDLSRLEAGKAELQARPMSLREVVESATLGLTGRAEEKGLELRVEVDEQIPERVLGDPVRLGQVLSNLVGNAIKFTEHGSVIVTVRKVGSSSDAPLEFTVQDTGIGIPADRLSRIFEEFSQASYEIGMRYGGSGLGLAICRRILALYGSRMEVHSVEGEGATFSFRLELPSVPADSVQA